jgi:carbonic anhydrase
MPCLNLRRLQNMPTMAGQKAIAFKFNPNILLPSDLSYFTYDGSLTQPPCTEGVTWVVLEQPLTMTMAQLNQMKLKSFSRASQALGSRQVQHMLTN